MSHPLRKVVIVGGGSAGWLTAGLIAAKHPRLASGGLEVCLIESPDVPIVGVGEGTWPTMRSTLHTIGVSETDFFRECNAAFKQGAKFSRWVTGEPDDFYYHPLVLPQGYLEGNLVPYWSTSKDGKSFSAATCFQEHLCERNLAPKQITTPEYAGVANYAYHLDAGKFSEFLKRHCREHLSVEHISANVVGISSQDSGDIAALSLDSGTSVEGDLFIDCTGFRSLLLGQHFEVPFVDRKPTLFIDKALAIHVPYMPDDPLRSQTNSTAQSAGWIWDIGLSTRRGVGHVYSSAHTDEETALRELRAYVGDSLPPDAEFSPRQIDIVPGHRQKFWHRNCVGVGLSAGFLEPLEASALVLVELSANMIADQLPVNRAAMDIVAKRFNRKFLYRWDRIIDFLKLHYVLSKRTDNEFWIDNRDPRTIPGSLLELLELWKHQSPWHDDFDHKDEVFPSASYQFVLYGMGFDTALNPRGLTSQDEAFAQRQFVDLEKKIEDAVTQLPTNRDLLKKIAEFGMQKI